MNKTRKIVELLTEVVNELQERAKPIYKDSNGKETEKYNSPANQEKALEKAVKSGKEEDIREAMQMSGGWEYTEGQRYEADYILTEVWRILDRSDY